MRRLLQIISWLALAGTIVPSAMFYLKRIDLAQCQWAMLLATIVWFAVTPFWMGRQHAPAEQATEV